MASEERCFGPHEVPGGSIGDADIFLPDIRLQSGSPAIDAGALEGAPTIDLEGKTRPCGNGVDMGAYEYCGADPPNVQFRRGDANEDGAVDLPDAVRLLMFLFADKPAPRCQKSADADDSGALDVTDAMKLLQYLFLRGAPQPAPFLACGADSTPDALPCPTPSTCR